MKTLTRLAALVIGVALCSNLNLALAQSERDGGRPPAEGARDEVRNQDSEEGRGPRRARVREPRREDVRQEGESVRGMDRRGPGEDPAPRPERRRARLAGPAERGNDAREIEREDRREGRGAMAGRRFEGRGERPVRERAAVGGERRWDGRGPVGPMVGRGLRGEERPLRRALERAERCPHCGAIFIPRGEGGVRRGPGLGARRPGLERWEERAEPRGRGRGPGRG